MLPCELVEEFVGGDGSTRFDVLKTASRAVDCLLVVLTLPVEILREGIVESINDTLPMLARVLL